MPYTRRCLAHVDTDETTSSIAYVWNCNCYICMCVLSSIQFTVMEKVY